MAKEKIGHIRKFIVSQRSQKSKKSINHENMLNFETYM